MRKKIKGLYLVLTVSTIALVVCGLTLSFFQEAPAFESLKGPLFQESLKHHPIDPNSFQGKIINTIKKVSPAVVSISTERTIEVSDFGGERFFSSPDFNEFFRRFFEQFPQRKFRQRGLGSGMIINEDGYILTNEHVIHGVDKDKITVTLPTNERFKARIVGTDVESDIAVLKINAHNLPSVVLGDSDNLQVGEWVIALGNPFGFALSELNKKYEPTVTVGVVSATGRAIQAGGAQGERRVYAGLIQTDASINPGNSGGPLVNIYGEVIGINTAILSPTGGSIGIGFAIPINKAKKLLRSLVKYGEIKWPWIGIYMQELTPELAKKFGVKRGVLVADVVSGSPAEKAGIKPGDVIQEVNGKAVESPVGLKEAVLKTEIGQKIEITLVREGKVLKVELVTAPKPERITKAGIKKGIEEKLLGIKVEEITPELRQRYGLIKGEKGVVVTKVIPGGPADQVGITPGDVIKGLDHKKIDNLSDFEAAMASVKPGDIILLRLRHGLWTMFVTVKTRG